MSQPWQVTIKPEDQLYAQRQDRYNCAIVRAIQREYPDALFVRADTEVIAFSEGNHRYEFVTPDNMVEKVIKPFDVENKPMTEPMVFALGSPVVRQRRRETIPVEKKKQSRQEKRMSQARRKTTNLPGNRHDANRFCDPEGDE